jgi:hypothetical protein
LGDRPWDRISRERTAEFLIDQRRRGIYASLRGEVNPLHALFFRVWHQRPRVSGRLGPAFGQIFGNTVHSAAIVVAIFMIGLGAGGYLFDAWADRRDQSQAGLSLNPDLPRPEEPEPRIRLVSETDRPSRLWIGLPGSSALVPDPGPRNRTPR